MQQNISYIQICKKYTKSIPKNAYIWKLVPMGGGEVWLFGSKFTQIYQNRPSLRVHYFCALDLVS